MDAVCLHLHPVFVEEMAALPPDIRIRLCAMLLRQYGDIRGNLDRYMPVAGDRRLSYSTYFHIIHHAPRMVAFFDNRAGTPHVHYLGVMVFADDETLVDTSIARLKEIGAGDAPDPVEFFTWLNDHADEGEKNAALDLNLRMEEPKHYASVASSAWRAAYDETRALFNVNVPQMDRIVLRHDHLLDTFARHIRRGGGQVKITLSFAGGYQLEFDTLSALKTLRE